MWWAALLLAGFLLVVYAMYVCSIRSITDQRRQFTGEQPSVRRFPFKSSERGRGSIQWIYRSFQAHQTHSSHRARLVVEGPLTYCNFLRMRTSIHSFQGVLCP